MATETATISLNEELQRFARADMAAGGFSSLNEYVRDLIRRRREQRVKEELDLLDRAMAKAPRGEPPARFLDAVAAAQREHRRRR
jgi:Arc/MetJ-type ribon-helix-helix transcriptional regulator